MTICDFPASSKLASELSRAFYHDSYEAPLKRADLAMHEIYLAILGHLPWWARVLIVVRNNIVSLFGLRVEPAARVWRTEFKDSYVPGEKIARFKLYSQDQSEIIAGENDKHLDFRVSVLKVSESGTNKVIVSTVIFAHNFFGKVYLLFVLPFHRFGLRHLLSQAVIRERI